MSMSHPSNHENSIFSSYYYSKTYCIGEIQALSVRDPYLRIWDHRIILKLDPAFIPKVASYQNLNQEIALPLFCENPSNEKEQALHTLDVRHAVIDYIEATHRSYNKESSADDVSARIFLINVSGMNKDRGKMAERIINLTLEIIFHLTGEDYTVVKTSSDRSQAPVSEGRGRPLSPILGPPPHSRIHEDINDQKILVLANKMIELLTGEVPIRCQDVTVYFSMEEWEYLEGHKDRYQEVMMEEHRPRTSPGNRHD
ncbi:uncharacterized protein [Ranitomeya imitator]|uniref:uncharacterized protein n=1 Tax=Ranitomeya imitator TaxID=111125 RepID=UPI0037E92080